METSRECDRLKHAECDGSVMVFDQDGPTRYTCGCSCHNTEFNERDCHSCRGTGKVHEVRSFGRYSTVPGPVPQTSPSPT